MEGMISASQQPHLTTKDNLVRQGKIVCYMGNYHQQQQHSHTNTNATTSQSVSDTLFEVTFKQQGNQVIHLPISSSFESSRDVVVTSDNGLICDSFLKTIDSNGEVITRDEECLDVEVYLTVTYQKVN
eukprot:gene11256-12554_t